MSQELLTAISSGCIALSGISLLVGWYLIRFKRNKEAHRNAMLLATTMAAIFLVAYVTRWSMYGSKPFEGTGAWKALYLGILFPHILLAAIVPFMALRLIYLAAKKQDFDAHRKLGRVTVPVWVFVSASGWVIYVLLYKVPFP